MRYSETIGQPVIDWKKELTDPNREWLELKRFSSSWATCVCGQMDSRVPRNEVGHAPKDNLLLSLGSHFTLAFNICDREKCLDYYQQICDRCDQLGFPVPGEEIESGHRENTRVDGAGRLGQAVPA